MNHCKRSALFCYEIHKLWCSWILEQKAVTVSLFVFNWQYSKTNKERLRQTIIHFIWYHCVLLLKTMNYNTKWRFRSCYFDFCSFFQLRRSTFPRNMYFSLLHALAMQFSWKKVIMIEVIIRKFASQLHLSVNVKNSNTIYYYWRLTLFCWLKMIAKCSLYFSKIVFSSFLQQCHSKRLLPN